MLLFLLVIKINYWKASAEEYFGKKMQGDRNTHIADSRRIIYGIKCVGRIVTKSMSYFLHLCD